ncbi:MAG: dUTP diphosphatase [Rhodospirillales bacterium]|nr:dUTP diphosphatase [Rhodospirillales bacterium]
MTQMTVQIKRLRNGDGLNLPAYATPASAGMDLLAATDSPIGIEPGERIMVPTGIAIALPPGFEAQVRPRSGLALKNGVTVLNAPGTIDADYRGEIGVILINHGSETFLVQRGMRVAQMVFAQISMATWDEVAALPESERAEGGFGSTGISGGDEI